MRKTLTLLTVVSMLVLAIALPALAAYSDSGTVACGGNNIYVRSRTYGEGTVQVPSGTVIDTINYGSYTVQYNYTFLTGTRTWKVHAWGGDVDVAQTYASCWGS